MTTPATDRPGQARAERPADPPDDRDERRVRAMVDALQQSGRDSATRQDAGSGTEQEARWAALRTLLDYGEIEAR
jgi:hypothetical protein